MRFLVLFILSITLARFALSADDNTAKNYRAYKDVSYYDGPGRDTENFQTLDVYAPRNAVNAPVLRSIASAAPGAGITARRIYLLAQTVAEACSPL